MVVDSPGRINSNYNSVYCVGNCGCRKEGERKKEADSFPFHRNGSSPGTDIEKMGVLLVTLIN